MRGERQEARIWGFLPPELTAWFSALLVFCGAVGVLGYLAGNFVIAPMFLSDGFARHCMGAAMALMSLWWAFKRWQVQMAFRFFWAELAAYFVPLYQCGAAGVFGYLAAYFVVAMSSDDGWARHCVGAVVALVAVRWKMKQWRAFVLRGEANQLYEEAKSQVSKEFDQDVAVEDARDYFSALLGESWQGRRGLGLWLSALKFAFFDRPGAKLS